MGSNELVAWPGTRVGWPVPSVFVEDRRHNPVRGALVKFTASSGSSVKNATALTDVWGMAFSGGWVLGPEEGTYLLTATVDGLEPVVFRGTAHKGVISDVYQLETIGGRTLPAERMSSISCG